MSGFEAVAAALGVAELTLRSISQVYEFTRYIEDAPSSVRRLNAELCDLNNCLSELASLSIAGSPAHPVSKRLSLLKSVNKCGETCSSLKTNLQRWTEGGSETIASRLRVRINKNQIESALGEISETKNKLHFAVAIASLRLQADMAERKPQNPAVKNRMSPEELAYPENSAPGTGQLVPRKAPASMSSEKEVVRSAPTSYRPDANTRKPDRNHEHYQGPSPTFNVFSSPQQIPGASRRVDGNEVENSLATKIGREMSVPAKEYSASNNKVSGSNDTVIG